jgi:acetoin:2,6-dichlorophenolindophenol oxidoreductase subunit alpha
MLDTGPAALAADQLREMYRLMLLSRRFNEHVHHWYKEGRLPQGLHPSIGQEAVGVGACYGLHRGDWVVPSLRTAEAFWARGVTILQQLNAMMGNAESVSRGKETSHHAGYPDHGILAATGIVGGAIPVATGCALALRMQRTEHIVVCFFGDGAANRGDFHEALNLAAVLKAPVVFVCENNLYAQMVPASAAMAIADIADRAQGYGMPGHIVDGQDVVAVHEATQAAVARARRGEGPTLLECKTYRFYPHYPIFEENRPPEEIARWLQRDPITLLGARLKEQGQLDDAAIDEMNGAILQELAAAIRQAETTPAPDPHEVFEQIYAGPFEEVGL